MLVLARAARGLTQTELLRLAPLLSQSKLSKIEAGLIKPSNEEVSSFASALKFQSSFFYKPHSRRALPAAYHRKRQRLNKGDWEEIYARAELLRIVIAEMLRSVELNPKRRPAPNIEAEESDYNMEEVAEAVRQAWAVPRGPIADITRLLEAAGIIVVHMDFGTDLVDGFSQHGVDSFPPIIFVNKKLSIDRLRFTLCHELCHLVAHLVPNANMERQANSFASAFLMPRDDIRAEFHSMSMDRLMALKLTWKTSMSALARRAFDLNRIREPSYKYYNIELRRRWGVIEPVEILEEIEKPKILRQLYEAHTQKLGYSVPELATLFGWLPVEVEETFGVARPRLRVVTS